jgi:predicted enzyme related to lactoylglutathione lyase
MQVLVHILCRDAVAQCAFYAAVLGGEELVAHRSPIYRAVGAGGATVGLNAEPAYTLLGLAGRRPAADAPPATTVYPTFVLDGPDAVDAALARAEAAGGTVLKRPFATYYGQWQALAADPEGNALRFASTALPAGVAAPALADPLPAA